MADNVAPHIENRWACIATDAQVVLASVVSSYFQDPGTYFAVFEFPSIESPYSPSIDYGRDGAFARILGTRAALWINNALAGIQPETILLLGLTEDQKSYLLPHLPLSKLIEIKTVDEISKRLPFAPSKEDCIACKSSDIVEGLLLAKFSHKCLIVDESASALPKKRVDRSAGIVLIESDRGIEDIIAINYAFAVNADAVLVPPVELHEIQALPRQLEAWSTDRSSRAFEEPKRKITERIKGIDFSPYRFATFFTVGLPYGLVLKNVIPCSHVLKSPACGVFLVNNIIEEHDPVNFGSALVFSPELFASEETGDIAKTLDANNYTVKLLLGEDATVKQLENYGSLFPFDMMHICSHGGETDGYFATQDFVDRLGKKHTLEFYEIVGFSPTKGDKVRVERKAIFAALDGFTWRSEPLKTYPKYVFEDMFKALKEDSKGVVRNHVNEPIALSCHIQCHDSIHQGAFDSLAGFGHPIVFNNTCSSSHEMAATFMAAGARSYIGTLWPVENTVATEAAGVFYREVARQGSIPTAFAAMNKSISKKHWRNVYIYWGLHFSSVRKPSQRSDRRIFAALIQTYFLWLKKIATTADPEVKRNSLPKAQFLAEQIVKMFSRDRLDEIMGFDPDALEEYERTLPPRSGDDFRGVTEMTISSEVRNRGKKLAE